MSETNEYIAVFNNGDYLAAVLDMDKDEPRIVRTRKREEAKEFGTLEKVEDSMALLKECGFDADFEVV